MNYPNYPPQQTKNPLHKRAWFWIAITIGTLGTIVIVTIAAIALLFAGSTPAPQPAPEATTSVAAETPEPATTDAADVPREWENALTSGQKIADRNNSKVYVYRTLTSEVYGFPDEAAQYAIDNITDEWNERALNAAKQIQDRGNSHEYVRRTLSSDVYGFTDSEVEYAMANLEP